MKCTNCMACSDNGGHCVNEDIRIGEVKPEMVTIPRMEYEHLQDTIRKQDAQIRYLTSTR
jgi:hypothetical protein